MDPTFLGLPWAMNSMFMQYRSARDYFDTLNDEEKKEFIERTRSYLSEKELKYFTDSIMFPDETGQ